MNGLLRRRRRSGGGRDRSVIGDGGVVAGPDRIRPRGEDLAGGAVVDLDRRRIRLAEAQGLTVVGRAGRLDRPGIVDRDGAVDDVVGDTEHVGLGRAARRDRTVVVERDLRAGDGAGGVEGPVTGRGDEPVIGDDDAVGGPRGGEIHQDGRRAGLQRRARRNRERIIGTGIAVLEGDGGGLGAGDRRRGHRCFPCRARIGSDLLGGNYMAHNFEAIRITD